MEILVEDLLIHHQRAQDHQLKVEKENDREEYTIKELMDILPQIIMYIVTGYVFLKTYHFVALKQNSDDIEHILTGSLVVGFIYCKIAYMIPYTLSAKVDNVLIVLSALCLGYLLAIIFRQKKIVYYILDKLKIRDTGNVYIWDDMMDNRYPMKVSIAYDDVIYIGMVHNFESYTNNPHIALVSYIVKDTHGKIINDYSADDTKVIILNTEVSKYVEIEYYSDSDECKDIKNLCDFNKAFKEQEKP